MQAKMFGLQTEKKSLLELVIQDGDRQIYLDPMNGLNPYLTIAAL